MASELPGLKQPMTIQGRLIGGPYNQWGTIVDFFGSLPLQRRGTSVPVMGLYGREKSGRSGAGAFDEIEASAEMPLCQT